MSLPTTILSPAGILGYGISERALLASVDAGVDVMIVDAGSTDPGPYMLGLGATLVSDEAYVRDLTPLLSVVAEHRIPLIIGSAGGAGTDEQVDHTVALIERIVTEAGHRPLRVASIYAEVDPQVALDALVDGRMEADVRGLLPSESAIAGCTSIVAQMGIGPFAELLDGAAPDVIVAGRAYDPAPYAAWAIRRGADPGVAWHMGKILECGGACAEPKGGGVIATVYSDRFELTPMGASQSCTPLSVAAHTLYEKRRPDLLPGPDGVLDVQACTYTALDDRTVRVAGSRHRPADALTLKLEGASVVGHRAMFIGGVRDPILIAQIQPFLDRIRGLATSMYPDLASGEAQLDFKVYGIDGVLGRLETSKQTPHEVGVLGEVTAPTPELAKEICGTVRIGVLHLGYEGQMATAGNLALPLNPIEIPVGPVCRFDLYHVIDAATLHLFTSTTRTIGPSS